MNQHYEALPEINIEEFRERHPQIFSGSGVDEIYGDPGWKLLLIALRNTIQDCMKRHPEVRPVTVGHIESKFGELQFFYDGGAQST